MIKLTNLAPLITQDQEAIDLAKQINALEEQYNQKVVTIRATCPHANVIKTWKNPNSFSSSEKAPLLQTECTDCGLIRKKPEGMSWTICEVCWGKMADDGHGRDGNGDRAHFYKCTVCGHTDYHT